MLRLWTVGTFIWRLIVCFYFLDIFESSFESFFAGKFGLQECLYHLFGLVFLGKISRNHQNIHVIVVSTRFDLLRVFPDPRPDPVDFIGRNLNPAPLPTNTRPIASLAKTEALAITSGWAVATEVSVLPISSGGS